MSILGDLREELERLEDAEELLRTILLECGKYGYKIDGMSSQTWTRARRYMKFDDSE